MKPLAILCSDLHFSAVVPSARSAEPDWFAAQKRYLDQLKDLQQRYARTIVVAGDLFHKWHPPIVTHELVNFLLRELPDEMYVLPGQHDLPDHRWNDRTRSPYFTLVMAGKVVEILPEMPHYVPGDTALFLYGFPWGFPITPMKESQKCGKGNRAGDDFNAVHLAVVHSYIWKAGHSYPDAPAEQHAEHYMPKLAGYDAAVFGDNHQGFMIGRNIINTGTFMRRRSDERDYKPMVGILYDDGHIEPHYLDTSADLWLGDGLPEEREPQKPDEDSGLLNSLNELGPDALDFDQALSHCMDRRQTSADVRRVISNARPGQK
jgi:DNA repair exonuclease SbcCD nuclease subunit